MEDLQSTQPAKMVKFNQVNDAIMNDSCAKTVQPLEFSGLCLKKV